jgi:hypothetical protein
MGREGSIGFSGLDDEGSIAYVWCLSSGYAETFERKPEKT